jgi:hypothetical protein
MQYIMAQTVLAEFPTRLTVTNEDIIQFLSVISEKIMIKSDGVS